MSRLRMVMVIALLLSFVSGCGEESKPAKADLNEKDKAQVKELNDQRASEWSTTPKKK